MKKILLAATLVFANLFLVATPALAAGCDGATGSKQAICEGIGASGQDDGGSTIFGVISKVINVISIVLGIIAVIMILVGGVKYVTSGGESASTASAKNTIIYALVGLAVALLSQALVRFVLYRLDNPVSSSPNSQVCKGITCPR